MDHVAMSVKDMDRCIAFYRDVVGMEVVFDRVYGEDLGRVAGLPGGRARVVHLRLGEEVLELFDYLYPRGEPPDPDRRQCDLGLTHIGFRVDDFAATYRALQERGVEFVGEALEIRPGVTVAYFYGPERVVCEIREIRAL
jgi:catechol 2,3-dioxygenase-like lactoylglutathione lyase family enzyme